MKAEKPASGIGSQREKHAVCTQNGAQVGATVQRLLTVAEPIAMPSSNACRPASFPFVVTVEEPSR
jgi:hypothetical protein